MPPLQELEAFLMAFKLKNHLFPDENARCYVPDEAEDDGEVTDILIKAQKMAEDIDKSNPVRMLTTSAPSSDEPINL